MRKFNSVITCSIICVMVLCTAIVLFVAQPGKKPEVPNVTVEQMTMPVEESITAETTMTAETIFQVVEESSVVSNTEDDYFVQMQSPNPEEYTVLTAVNGRVYMSFTNEQFSNADWLSDLRVLKAALEDDEYVFNTTKENYVIYPETYVDDGNNITVRVDFVWNGEVLEYNVYVDKKLRSIRVDV